MNNEQCTKELISEAIKLVNEAGTEVLLSGKDGVAIPIDLAPLAGILLKLWDTDFFLEPTNEHHAEILATLENGVLLASGNKDGITTKQLRTFKDALKDLAKPHLTKTQANKHRARFIKEEFGPLGFVDNK
ncbi:MAG TPA: hypothetical protein ENH82_07240 [bacterium]|nr:hypothetical protein [bacterium]